MEKDFDSWNYKKKLVNRKDITRLFFKEREIWWCSLGINVGFEQDGIGEEFQRPVLILKKFGSFGCIVVPLTTRNKNSRHNISIGEINRRQNYAVISQIRFLDTKRLLKKMGRLGKDYFEEIQKAVTQFFR